MDGELKICDHTTKITTRNAKRTIDVRPKVKMGKFSNLALIFAWRKAESSAAGVIKCHQGATFSGSRAESGWANRWDGSSTISLIIRAHDCSDWDSGERVFWRRFALTEWHNDECSSMLKHCVMMLGCRENIFRMMMRLPGSSVASPGREMLRRVMISLGKQYAERASKNKCQWACVASARQGTKPSTIVSKALSWSTWWAANNLMMFVVVSCFSYYKSASVLERWRYFRVGKPIHAFDHNSQYERKTNLCLL